MRLARLFADHYRSFESIDLELRPLTLLYGDNSAGKSALLRLLPLLGGSLSYGAQGMLNLTHPANHGSSFENLIGARWRSDDPSFRLGLAWEDGLRVRWNLGLVPDRSGGQNIPTLLDLHVDHGAERVHLQHSESLLERDEASLPMTELRLESLRPVDAGGPLRVLGERLRTLVGQIQYLGPTRVPARSRPEGQWEVGMPLAPDGVNALRVLSKDQGVENEVRDFLVKHCARMLEREGAGESERWTLSPLHRSEWKVPLAEAGVGMGQLLPELVTLALRRSASRPSGFLAFALEEPATHLHDRLQLALAEHLASIAAEPNPTTTLVETHSRPMLTGIQLAIARKKIDPDQVILHWIDQDERGMSRVSPITFDRRGLPEGERLTETFQAETHALADLADLALQQQG